ncbi:oxidoreductase [Rhodococcus erythropolis]|uniref:oxidoreductase n=1 Tax=Rhodococcus erythropolis TaxID=1833 RepID=UPI001BE5037E|nr:flavin oxidoreductase [Rhodococcus erythropolis]MBT2268986.1 flavin oxidoreductase [Rhodococcus erythropolis]
MDRTSVWDSLALRCGKVLPHRFVLAPMTTDSSHPDGTVSDDELNYLSRRAASGFAAVITSCAYVDPGGRAWQGIGASHDNQLESLSRLAKTIDTVDALGVLQLYDAGRLAAPALVADDVIRAPSAVPSARPGARTPRPLAGAEVDRLVDSFVAAARRGVDAGFDGIELHGANHYLIHQFFSPRSNRRTDKWGTDLNGRMSFAIEVASRVRSEIGDDVALGFRLNPFEVEQNGFTLDMSVELAHELSALNLDYLHISMDNFRKNAPQPEDRDWTQSMRSVSGRSPIEAIAQAVDGRCAVVASGGIHSTEHGQEALDLGADLLAVGRAALTDPEWLGKVRNGEESSITRLLPATAENVSERLTIPDRMAKYLMSRPGWIPAEPAQQAVPQKN